MKFIKIILINTIVFFCLCIIFGIIYYQVKKSRPRATVGRVPIIEYNISELTPVPQKYDFDNSFLSTMYPNASLNAVGYDTKTDLRIFKNRRNQIFRTYKNIKNTDQKVYDAAYTLNSFGHRAVQNQENKKNSKYYLALFGCSYTFGEGLSDGYDYPSLLAGKLGNSWKVFNYAYSGYGPNSTIHQIMKQKDYFGELKESSGIFVWYYITDHLNRYFCSLECYNKDRSWNLFLPDISIENEVASFHGTFLSNKESPLRRIGSLYNSLGINKNIDLPAFNLTSNQIKEFALSVDYIAHQLPKRPFKKVLLIYNFDDFTADLVENFSMLGFDIINLQSVLHSIPADRAVIALDHHPNQVTNWYVSEILKKYISDHLKMDITK